MELPRSSGGLSIETVESNDKMNFDDDGHAKRNGTVMTVSAHIITAVIGSGVLSLAWAIAQLGWIAGVISLIMFSVITLYTSNLLADCYRFPDAIKGTRNYTYMEAVEKFLGGLKYKLCGWCQYMNLVGTSIGYTITTALSFGAIQKSICHNKHGREAKCHESYETFTIIFGIVQILLSQIPNFRNLSGLSILAAAMSFTYSLIGVSLAITKIAAGSNPKTSLTGITVGPNMTSSDKVWRCFQALGNIAFAYGYSQILIEIEDTIKSGKPENRKMKQATMIAIAVTTTFYMLCGLLGYVAFGDNTPGNFLAGFGFFEPSWIVDLANVCIVVHLVGAYQVFAQPVFQKFEGFCREKWPESEFVTKEHVFGLPFLGSCCSFNFLRFFWRSSYVTLTCGFAIMFPFFNDILGLLGALIFWPLTVYFPVEMHISQKQIHKFSARWIGLNLLSFCCLVISILAAAGSIQGVAKELKTYRPFMTKPDS